MLFRHMDDAPDNHELARQVAVLEERMNTKQAEYQTDIARLAEDMAKQGVQAANDRWWQTAIILAGIGIAATVLGIVLS